MSRRTVWYLAWIVLILVALILPKTHLELLRQSGIREMSIIPYFAVKLGLFLLIGVILGSDCLIQEIKKSGSWQADILKIVLCGIPLGLVACSPIFYFGINVPFITNYIASYFMNIDSGQIAASQIILGYVLTTSFFKTIGPSQAEAIE